MNVQAFYRLIDGLSPFLLSKELCEKEDLYDNSGVIIDAGKEFDKVLCALDLSVGAVEEAKRLGCGLIFTHHPAIYRPIKNVGGAVLESAKAGISVISAHLNLDCAPRGIDYNFAKALGAENEKILTPLSVAESGYGRSFSVNLPLDEFVEKAEKGLNTKAICYGDKNSFIKTAASFCGEGLDELAFSEEADVYCSADVKHHVILAALERGKAVVSFTHYASENYGMKKFAEELTKKLSAQNIKIYYFDDTRFV
ncbi:MAG TPA: Nif3-like dinuclear metal center hexameric protein [Clostridiales bacterium]|nr:Nif3-like dinuclear metal center hexameric protein [Clostridiales bacterium]